MAERKSIKSQITVLTMQKSERIFAEMWFLSAYLQVLSTCISYVYLSLQSLIPRALTT